MPGKHNMMWPTGFRERYKKVLRLYVGTMEPGLRVKKKPFQAYYSYLLYHGYFFCQQIK